ncbi:hypothetical protein J2T13_002463 [Paenibacillus sp. DS2015]|uniref:PsbP-related protein n=1 Tax=Paenibacillus sp. DS2015 TaxID=3373917 RepID=UPI003D216414
MNSKRFKLMVLTAVLATGVLAGCAEKEAEISNTTVGSNSKPTTETMKDSPEAEPEVKGTLIKSANEDIQLTIPTDWIEDEQLNDSAIISASKQSQDKYVMVIANQKSDFSDETSLDDFVNIFKENTKISVDQMKVVNTDDMVSTEDIEVDGVSAKLVEFTGEVQKIKAHYLTAMIEKGNRFYQIISWSSEKGFSNSKDEFLEIIKSFKVLKEEDSVSLSPVTNQDQGETAEFTSEDGMMTISLPANWNKQSNLMEDADIQASKIDSEDYLGIISEDKELFADDTTLEEYHKLIVESQTNSGVLENLKIHDPVKTQVDGRDALQFEVTGEITKVKVAYLFTLVDHPHHFTQVIFWTIDQYFNDRKPLYQDMTQTLTVKEN